MTQFLHPRRLSLLAMAGAALSLATNPSFAACLVKPMPPIQGITLHVLMLAPASQVPEYVSLGFQKIPCPSDLTQVRAYVSRLCSGAPLQKAPALDTDMIIGRSRDYACASAQAGLAEAGG